MRANQLKKEYKQSLEAIKINIPLDMVQEIVFQCLGFLLKNAREHVQELNVSPRTDTVHIAERDILLEGGDYPTHATPLFLNTKKERLVDQDALISSNFKHHP